MTTNTLQHDIAALRFIARTLSRYVTLSEQSFEGYKPAFDYGDLLTAEKLSYKLLQSAEWRDYIENIDFDRIRT